MKADKFLQAFKLQGGASISGYEGYLTPAMRIRVSPEPIKKIQMGGIFDLLGCDADDRCKPEQMRGTEPPKGKHCSSGRGESQLSELPISVRAPNKKQKREEHELEPVFYCKKKRITFPHFVQRIHN